MRYILKTACFAAVLCILAPINLHARGKTPSDHVNVFIGTHGVGHTFPGATIPFGLVQLSPDTRVEDWSACSGYQWEDTSLYGFSHTHLSGTGGGDLGDILFLPLSGSYDETFLTSRKMIEMDKETETGEAGYYSVKLRNGVSAELTATPRVGVHRYTFPKGENRMLLIDLVHAIKEEGIDLLELRQTSPTEITGMRRGDGWADTNQIFFVARFSEPAKNMTALLDGRITADKVLSGTELKAVLEFGSGNRPVEVVVGISGTGYDGARKNLDSEAPKPAFDKYRKAARKIWNDRLGVVAIGEGATDEELTIFYTALYHTMVCPNIFSDVDGTYRGMDGKAHRSAKPHYTLFSLWDTFRAVHPFFNIIDPRLSGDMMRSLVEKGEQNGRYPKWELWAGDTGVMIGNHAISVLGEAIAKGIEGFDYGEAYRVAKMTLEANREQLPLYIKYGYIPSNEVGLKSVSKTVEYAYNDYCMALIARELRYMDDYDYYLERSKNYRNVFDGETEFFRGRENTGQFEPGFNGRSMGNNFTEATPWQYRHFAPHDIRGLACLLGGRDSLASSLDALFKADEEILGRKLPDVTGLIGQYAHGNEPSHSTAFLYVYSSEPWKTSAYTREIIRRFYMNKPDGLCGNDDCGQMSAWYVFASLGMYPVNPAGDQFILTAPVFGDATVSLPGGKKFRIKVTGDRKDVYINKVWLNGDEIDRNYVTYAEIMAGGELVFELGDRPNTERGISEGSMPYSMTQRDFAPTPYVEGQIENFEDRVLVELKVRNPKTEIFYTLDGSDPDRGSTRYTGPFELTDDAIIRAVAYVDGMERSDEMTRKAFKAHFLPAHEGVTPARKGALSYEYYEGPIKLTSDMLSMQPLRTGITENTDVKAIAGDRKEHYGIIFRGWLEVDERGIYKYGLQSDDGSVMLIDDVVVVTHDGSHSGQTGYGWVALEPGLHKLEIRYFQDTEGAGLQLYARSFWSEFNSIVFGPINLRNIVYAEE